jgi:hypothetical protein
MVVLMWGVMQKIGIMRGLCRWRFRGGGGVRRSARVLVMRRGMIFLVESGRGSGEFYVCLLK